MRCKCFAEDHAEDCDLIDLLTAKDKAWSDLVTFNRTRAERAEAERDELRFRLGKVKERLLEVAEDPRAPKPSYVPAAVPPARGGRVIYCDRPIGQDFGKFCTICNREHP
jgi:hypothetical protein